jgi:hypothetical protein
LIQNAATAIVACDQQRQQVFGSGVRSGCVRRQRNRALKTLEICIENSLAHLGYKRFYIGGGFSLIAVHTKLVQVMRETSKTDDQNAFAG